MKAIGVSTNVCVKKATSITTLLSMVRGTYVGTWFNTTALLYGR